MISRELYEPAPIVITNQQAFCIIEAALNDNEWRAQQVDSCASPAKAMIDLLRFRDYFRQEVQARPVKSQEPGAFLYGGRWQVGAILELGGVTTTALVMGAADRVLDAKGMKGLFNRISGRKRTAEEMKDRIIDPTPLLTQDLA